MMVLHIGLRSPAHDKSAFWCLSRWHWCELIRHIIMTWAELRIWYFKTMLLFRFMRYLYTFIDIFAAITNFSKAWYAVYALLQSFASILWLLWWPEADKWEWIGMSSAYYSRSFIFISLFLIIIRQHHSRFPAAGHILLVDATTPIHWSAAASSWLPFTVASPTAKLSGPSRRASMTAI